MTIVTCLKCGRVSMGVTKEYAEKEVADFNDYWDKLGPEEQSYWSGHASVNNYRCCKNMILRPSEEGDCPAGCTLNPVISD